jgi:glycosyltransferase involved in cell wall biosynthesis
VPVFSSRPRVRVLCLPDLDRAIGGVKQLHRHVEHLVALGWDAAMLTEAPGFRPSWFTSNAPTWSLAESHARGELTPEGCVLLVPETYLGADLGHFRGLDLSGLPRVVFNQNAYYSYGQIGNHTAGALAAFYDDPAVLQVLSISEDTHTFLARNLGLLDQRLSRIVNAIEPSFRPDQPKTNRLHWMPRKNPDHVQAVLQGLQRCGLRHSGGWQGEPLVQLSHAQVAERLNGARLFLAFGHPEGFGLPIAEAMAAGCWVVGYSGGGGAELFRLGASECVSFGDWPGFLAAIQRAFEAFAEQPRETVLRLQRQALAVRSLYSAEQERVSIAAAWERIAVAFARWRAGCS